MGGANVNKWLGKGWDRLQKGELTADALGMISGIPLYQERSLYQFTEKSGEDWQAADKEVAAEEKAERDRAAADAQAVKDEIARHNQALYDYNQAALDLQAEMAAAQEEYYGAQIISLAEARERLRKADEEDKAEKNAAKAKTERRLGLSAGGRKSTIMTGGTGSTGTPRRKVLLGE